MATGTITRQWQVANNGGWAETLAFWAGSVGSADNLAGCSAVINMLRPGRPASEVMTYASTDPTPYLSIVANFLIIAIPAAITLTWAPGAYDIQIRIIPASPGVDLFDLLGSRKFVLAKAPGT